MAFVDNTVVELNGEVYSGTVRTSSCEIIGHCVKCSSCKSHRATLRSMYHRWSKRPSETETDSSSHTNERYLNTTQIRSEIASLRTRAHAAEQMVAKLREKILKLTQDQGETLDDDFQSGLLGIMRQNKDKINSAYSEGSFSRLFWEEQFKAASAADARQVRWHPVIIKWCLNLKLLSTSAYHALRTSGFLRLPSARTLRDYTHYFASKPGFQD